MTKGTGTAHTLKDHPGSLYLQIASMLRRRISTGEWSPGEQLPTLEAMSREFGVARVTVRQAVGLLEEEGLIWRRQGKGTFVSEHAGTGPWISLQTEWDDLVGLVGRTRFRQIKATRAMPPLRKGEGRLASSYRHFRRIYTKDDKPYALLNLYLDDALYAQAPREFARRPAVTVINALPETGGVVTAYQRLTINTADLEVAELMKVPLNSPVAEVRRIMKDAAGTIVYFAEIIYRGEFVRLDITLK